MYSASCEIFTGKVIILKNVYILAEHRRSHLPVGGDWSYWRGWQGSFTCWRRLVILTWLAGLIYQSGGDWSYWLTWLAWLIYLSVAIGKWELLCFTKQPEKKKSSKIITFPKNISQLNTYILCNEHHKSTMSQKLIGLGVEFLLKKKTVIVVIFKIILPLKLWISASLSIWVSTAPTLR